MIILKIIGLFILLTFICLVFFTLLRCLDSSWSGKLKDLFKFDK